MYDPMLASQMTRFLFVCCWIRAGSGKAGKGRLNRAGVDLGVVGALNFKGHKPWLPRISRSLAAYLLCRPLESSAPKKPTSPASSHCQIRPPPAPPRRCLFLLQQPRLRSHPPPKSDTYR